MKTTQSGYFSRYWPVALALALIVLTALRAYGDGAAPCEPLAAEQVTAELARTVSYGLVGSDAIGTAAAVRHVAAPRQAPASSST